MEPIELEEGGDFRLDPKTGNVEVDITECHYDILTITKADIEKMLELLK